METGSTEHHPYLLLIACLVLLASCATRTGAGAINSSIDESDVKDLQTIADSLGSGSIDPAVPPPTTAEAVRTTRGPGLVLTYGTAEGDPGDQSAPVYVVQLQGAFRGYLSKGPTQESVDNIRGTALVFVYDITTERPIAWGISPNPHDLSSLGVVFTFPVEIAPTHATPSASSEPSQ